MSADLPQLTDHFAVLAPGYDVALCDVWGVVHNGVAATPQSCEALARFRRQGGIVVLITNAPRPGHVVQTFLDRLAVPREAYDGIVSSGDVTRAIMTARAGQSIFHIGPARDLPMFEGLDARVVDIDHADYVVCSGLADDTVETPEHYDPLIAAMRARALTMVCANPDIVVERGEHLVYCAGAIAERYNGAGGEVVYAGKPYRPIYREALALAYRLRGMPTEPHRVLAIGDSLRTDLKGAIDFGLDCLFVTAGIHAAELGGRERPDAAALGEIFATAGLYPKAIMRQLEW